MLDNTAESNRDYADLIGNLMTRRSVSCWMSADLMWLDGWQDRITNLRLSVCSPSTSGNPVWLTSRTVQLMKQDGRWVFEVSGEAVWPFEDHAAYARRLKRERFTPEMLITYLKGLGLDLHNPEFYDTSRPP